MSMRTALPPGSPTSAGLVIATPGEVGDTADATLPRFSESREIDGPSRWRRGSGFWLLYLASPLGSAWTDHRLAASIIGTILLVLFAFAYLFLVPLGWYGRGSARRSYAICVVLFALAVAETAVIGVNGLTALVFVAAGTMVLLPAKVGVPSVAVMAVTATVLPIYIEPWHVDELQWWIGISVAFASIAVFAFTRLVRANHELAAAREEVARLAAERERSRIARDLHDLLGHSLTTVTVKAALARRLVDTDPARAKAEIEAVERIARESLADTRTALAGYREVRLATELATAREVLAAAGIDADLPRVVDDVPADLGGLFGWVVREGITNVVRHSRARHVRVTVDGRAIEVVDDGQGCAGDPGGHGLTGLAERASALGGRLVAGPAEFVDGTGGFRLRIEVP